MSGLVVDLLFKGRVVRTIPFDRATLRIGRMRENEIAIDNLAVSRFHGRLTLENGRVFLEDNGSENGSYVNDRRIHGRVQLAPGDRITIGKHQLRVRTDLGGEAAAATAAAPEPRRSDAWDAQQTYFAGASTRAALLAEATGPHAVDTPPIDTPSIDTSSIDTPPTDAGSAEPAARRSEEPAAMHVPPPSPDRSGPAPEVPEPASEDLDFAAPELGLPELLDGAPSAPTAPAADLVDAAGAQPAAPPLHAGLIVQREGKLERIVPWEAASLTVGRSSDCDLVLGQDEVSRRHARFVREGDRYEVHDLGSVNGTLVNGERVERRVLAVGDVVQIESFQLTFVLDRDPITDAVKPVASPEQSPSQRPDTMGITILQEELSILDPDESPASAGPEPPPIPVEVAAPAAAGAVPLQVDLLGEPDEELAGVDLDERKELAAARPRGSSRASSVQDLGPAPAAPRGLVLEVRLALDELPAPLRRALEEMGSLSLPAEVRLRPAD